MLQQTQVATVIPFWHRWMDRFPTIEVLADASEDDVLVQWQGLGYYRRARLLRHGAEFVVAHGLPRSAKEWLAVPSVGRYTAGAIASIAQGEPVALVDGNVERVFARFFGLDAAGADLHRHAWVLAEQVVDVADPGAWNQALMELGATICRPIDPACSQCPIREACVARNDGRTSELPRIAPKAAPKAVRHARWIPIFGDKFGVERIESGPWWRGMWDFPRTEDEVPPTWVGLQPVTSVGHFRHAVTNHQIQVSVYRVECREEFVGLTWVTDSELDALALPAPARRAYRLAIRPTFFLPDSNE